MWYVCTGTLHDLWSQLCPAIFRSPKPVSPHVQNGSEEAAGCEMHFKKLLCQSLLYFPKRPDWVAFVSIVSAALNSHSPSSWPVCSKGPVNEIQETFLKQTYISNISSQSWVSKAEGSTRNQGPQEGSCHCGDCHNVGRATNGKWLHHTPSRNGSRTPQATRAEYLPASEGGVSPVSFPSFHSL